MLREIKAYLQTHGQASAQMLADRFDVELETVFTWMDYLIQQGQIQKIDAPSCTDSCGTQGCAATTPSATLYRWLPRAYRPLNISITAHSTRETG